MVEFHIFQENVLYESVVPEPEFKVRNINNAEAHANMETPEIANQDQESVPRLKRTKRCVDSLDRASQSPPHSEMPSRRKSKSPSVASEADYKEWFGKFNSNDSPELTVPEHDEYLAEEEVHVELNDQYINDPKLRDTATYIKVINKSNDIVGNSNEKVPNIENNSDSDVSVSVTLNLNQKSAHNEEFNSLKPTLLSKTDEFLQMERQSVANNKVTIQPSADQDHHKFVSYLHPEDFPIESEREKRKEPHEHHAHIHNVGYNEWMKKFVDHQSSHLSLSDSSSDSDGNLKENDCLPRFKTESKRKRKVNKIMTQPAQNNLKVQTDSLQPENRSQSPRPRSPIDPNIDFLQDSLFPYSKN